MPTLQATKMPAHAVEAFKKLTRQRATGGNDHPPMGENHYISGSLAVKLTCQALARAIVEDDASPPHWGENGNAIADINLVDVPYGENEAVVPIKGIRAVPEWNFVMHGDGLVLSTADGLIMPAEMRGARTFLDFCSGPDGETAFLCEVEHKAPVFPYDADTIDVVARQPLAHAGAVLDMHERGIHQLEPAHYLKPGDPRKIPMPLPEHLDAGAITLIIAPYPGMPADALPKLQEAMPGWDLAIIDEGRLEATRTYTRAEARAELDRLLGKSRAAILTATGQDPEAAQRWDREHATEFAYRTTERVPANMDEAHAEIAKLLIVDRVATLPDGIAKKAREKARTRIKALIDQHGLPAERAFDNGFAYSINAKGAITIKGDPTLRDVVAITPDMRALGFDPATLPTDVIRAMLEN